MPELDLAKATSPEIYGRECGGCHCLLDWIHYRRDSSMKDGRAALCFDCEAAPRLSTKEHTFRLYEQNYNSEAVKKQRWEDQDELRNDEARIGRPMLHSDFLTVVKRLVPSLYITEGRIIGDLAVYQTAPGPQKAWDDRDFRYLFYVPTGVLPEFSQYQFSQDGFDIPIRESRRGWRTVLLRLIKSRLLDEQTCNQVFGRPAECEASNRWYKQLQAHKTIN